MDLKNKYRPTAERTELLRIFWWFLIIWPLYLWSVVASVLLLVHFVQILVQGKRNEEVHNQISYFLKYQWQWTLYTFLLDDTKPNWNPIEFIEECRSGAKK